MSQDDFYHEKFQDRRCQLNIHNFPSYENERDNEPVLCKRCKFMKLPYDIHNKLEDNNDN